MVTETELEIDEKEPEHIDIRPNRNLLNPNFEKYIISSQDLPVVKQKLTNLLRLVEPSPDQWSRQELKLFSMVQPVYFDPVLSNEVVSHFFYMDIDGTFIKNKFDIRNKQFSQNIEIILTTPFLPTYESSLDKDHYPISMKFADQRISFVADGFGRLLVYNTGNRLDNTSWNHLETYCLQGPRATEFEKVNELGYPFIIIDVRTLSDTKYEVLLLSVFKRTQDEIKEDSEKTQFANGIHWLSFEITTNECKLTRSRRFDADGNLEFATFDRFAEHIIVLTGKKPVVIHDSNRIIRKIRKSNIESDKPTEVLYVWKQTGEDLTVLFKLPGKISKSDINVEIKSKRLCFKSSNDVLLDGELFAEIDVDESNWTLETTKDNGKDVTSVEITLSKKIKSSTKWSYLVLNDNKGKEIIEMVEQPAHIQMEESSLNPNQIEDVDMTSDDEINFLSWINGESDQVDKISNLSFHQILFTQQFDYNTPISLCVRDNVDGIIYGFNHPPFTHSLTLDAFGYIQAGKQNRKFTLCSPDGLLAAVVDQRNHAYIYYKGDAVTGSNLMNTKDKKSVSIAQQFVVSLINIDEDYQSGNVGQDIVATFTTNKCLFMATSGCFYAVCIG